MIPDFIQTVQPTPLTTEPTSVSPDDFRTPYVESLRLCLRRVLTTLGPSSLVVVTVPSSQVTESPSTIPESGVLFRISDVETSFGVDQSYYRL